MLSEGRMPASSRGSQGTPKRNCSLSSQNASSAARSRSAKASAAGLSWVLWLRKQS